MSNIKLPIQDKTISFNSDFASSNQINQFSNSKSNKLSNASKIALPITDIKKIATPIRDIILRASDDFALSIIDSGFGNYQTMSFAGQYSSSLDLIEVSPIGTKGKIFTDIFPKSDIYKGSISRMWRNIEEFYEFLKENKFYFGFLIYLFNELLTNLAYQSSLLAMTVVSLVEEAPVYSVKIANKYNRLLKILNNKQLRGMWWLNITTDLKILIAKMVKIAKIIWSIVSKFYLVSILVVCVGFLQNASPKVLNVSTTDTPIISRESVLEKYLLQNSIPVQGNQNNLGSNFGFSLVNTPKNEIDESSLPTTNIIKYIVKDGDTIELVAVLYNVSIETIANNNTINSEGLKAGQELLIPSVDSIIYTIKKGDSLEEVAGRYKLETITISSLNSDYLASNGFKEGNQILIPGISYDDYSKINNEIESKLAKTSEETKQLQAREIVKAKELEAKKKLIAKAKANAKDNNIDLEKTSCGLIWPTSTKNISQYPSKVHMALDIANRQLPDIYAAANGKVVFSGWDDSGYGNMILIDHGDGMKTRYAHNTQLYISVGDYVTQGQSIAQMGSTGRSTGPHLHYEVIQGGKLINPLSCY